MLWVFLVFSQVFSSARNSPSLMETVLRQPSGTSCSINHFQKLSEAFQDVAQHPPRVRPFSSAQSERSWHPSRETEPSGMIMRSCQCWALTVTGHWLCPEHEHHAWCWALYGRSLRSLFSRTLSTTVSSSPQAPGGEVTCPATQRLRRGREIFNLGSRLQATSFSQWVLREN